MVVFERSVSLFGMRSNRTTDTAAATASASMPLSSSASPLHVMDRCERCATVVADRLRKRKDVCDGGAAEHFVGFLWTSALHTFHLTLWMNDTAVWLVDDQRTAFAQRLPSTATELRRSLFDEIIEHPSDRFNWMLKRTERAARIGLASLIFNNGDSGTFEHHVSPHLIKQFKGMNGGQKRFAIRMLHIVRGHLAELRTLLRAPAARFVPLVTGRSIQSCDFERLRTEVSTEPMLPDIDDRRHPGSSLLNRLNRITNPITDAAVAQTVQEWLDSEEYTERSYVAENIRLKRPRLAPIESDEFFERYQG